MEIFNLIASIILLSLAPNHPTTLKFSDSIEYYQLGKQGDFITYLSHNKKILVVTPKVDQFNIPLVVLTKDSSFQFILKSSKKSPPLYLIKQGKKEKKYSLIKKGPSFRLLEGEASLLLYLEKDLKVNGTLQKSGQIFLPKGGMVMIEGVRIL